MTQDAKSGIDLSDQLRQGRAVRRRAVGNSSEREQALLRIAIVTIILVYLTLFDHGVPRTDPLLQTGILLFGVHLIIGILLLIWILLVPTLLRPRVVLGIVTDIGSFSLAMIVTGEVGAPWWAGCLWITFGNGFRFGERYLYLSAGLSIIGFSLAILLSDYWNNNLPIAAGLMISMLVLPGYAVVLIRRLQAERQRAEEANRSKSEFLARMSHEIRTPLNGIIGTGELLRSCQLGPQEREYVDTINTSGYSLLKLIEDILDISKIEAGKLELEHIPFDLHALISATLKMFTPEVERKGLRLASQIGIEIPFRLLGDPHHLRQVLVNLLSNAIKFTEQGSVKLQLTRVGGSSQQSIVRFKVVDTGIGIPPETQLRIFDNFAQADESTTRRFGGTGLGTSISKQLVEQMGGHIGLQSRPGSGTTFWFDLEFTHQAEWVDEQELQQVQRCRVLRLCQEPVESEVAHTLRGWGVPCDNVDTARTALRLLLEGRGESSGYQVLILDQTAAAAQVSELLGALRQELRLPDLLTLLIHESEEEALPNSGNLLLYSLALPFDRAQLFNLLHIARSRDSAPETTVTRSADEDGETFAHTTLNVVVAEDNSINRMVIGRILEQAQIPHRLVQNGRQLLEALESDHYDLAILDMHMPEIGGIEAFKAYRFAHPGSDRETPFIMLTANATVDARRECELAGIEYFLTKPVAAAKLLATISQATAHRQRDADPTPLHAAVPAPRSPASPETDATLDRRVFDELCELAPNAQFMRRLLEQLASDGARLLDDMQQAVIDRDSTRFRELAHALKGSAANLGLCKLASQLVEAEQLPAIRLAAEGSQRLESLRQALEEAKAAVAESLGYRLSEINPPRDVREEGRG